MLDEFDFKEEKPKKQFKLGSAMWNMASLFTLLATLCAGGWFTQIFFDPQSGLNPLPPVATAAPAQPTDILLPSATSEAAPTEAPTSEPPTATPEAAVNSFQIQEGSPVALDSSVFHPELGCNFLGVAGQVFDVNGTPVNGLRIHITGMLAGNPISELGVTGAATQYGTGSYYEIQLADAPTVSEGTLQIAVLDESDQPISPLVTFSTTDSCQQNLILINFSEQQ
jgi:hypothetical protein